jgi:hypothetical protein
LHRDYNDGGGSRPHDAIIGAHAVLLGARRLNLKRDRPLGLVGDPEGAGDLLVELDWARQEIARYQEKKIQTKKQEHPAKF